MTTTAALMVVLALAPKAAFATYPVTDSGTLGGLGRTDAMAINNLGQIVGAVSTAGGGTDAFIWEDGVMTGLRSTGGAVARGINDPGQVVGQTYQWQNGQCGLYWDGDVGMRPSSSAGLPPAVRASTWDETNRGLKGSTEPPCAVATDAARPAWFHRCPRGDPAGPVPLVRETVGPPDRLCRRRRSTPRRSPTPSGCEPN